MCFGCSEQQRALYTPILEFMEGKTNQLRNKNKDGGISLTFMTEKGDVLSLKTMRQFVNHLAGNYADFLEITEIFQTFSHTHT